MNLGKLLMTGVLATVLTSATFATVPTDSVKTAIVNAEQDAKPVEIKVAELPSAVQKTLKSDAYKDWNAEKAYVIQKKDKKVYKVEVTKGEENKTLLFNEDGEAIKK